MAIDLRSDTVTVPSPEMRTAMATAEVGDDVYGEDPTVNKLEEQCASMLGKDAALFVSSGTQGNLLGVMSHCGRGAEYIAGSGSHVFRKEAGGAAVLGSISPYTIPFSADGTLDLDLVEAAIKPDDYHMPITRLLCLEDTQGGKVLPLEYLARAEKMARDRKLALHLDGARVFNAAVKLEIDVTEITKHFDTVSVCLSKGLAAPVGSLLCGPADLVQKARRLRKMLGGGMRQAGILAAAGIVAVNQMVDRLAEDHANARVLADGLAEIPGITIDLTTVQTNMVFLQLSDALAATFRPFMAERGITIGGGPYPIRAVTHYGIDEADIQSVIGAASECSKRYM